MKLCVPKERYPLEKRVILTPPSVKELVDDGHKVFVEAGAGMGINISDQDYKNAGAIPITDRIEMYGNSEMAVKLKAPSPEEFSLMKGLILFGMFHSEQNPAYVYHAGLHDLVVVEMERIHDNKNERLVNQTQLTGEAGVLYSLRHCLKAPTDMKALILGYGNVSTGALKACNRLGMNTKILRKSEFKHVDEHLKDTDLLINGIAWPESARNKMEYVVTREQIKDSNEGMIVLDLSVDFPNPIETIKPTSYTHPYLIEEDRIHISLYGYPGLFPVTSSKIYSEQVLPLVKLIANNGGLRGIGNRGDLGAYIKKAILDPKKCDWEQYKPAEELAGSKIE